MQLRAATAQFVRVPLTRPYAIAGGMWDSAEMVLVRLETDAGHVGHGVAAPAEEVTGETATSALEALSERVLADFVGTPVTAALAAVATRVHGPAAQAALDMALHDLVAQAAQKPLVEHLGRAQSDLPTSVTIGVKDTAAALEEAEEYVARGLVCLKVKTGVDVDEDVARLSALRSRFGARVILRADANQGYSPRAFERFVPWIERLDLELVEQPLHPSEDAALLCAPPHLRRRLLADESVHTVGDVERLQRSGAPFGAINIKLMKCGGPSRALELAAAAERAGLDVMWGCMDESAAGIAAALHVAYACRATRYLDLDGSFDLAHDPHVGGFELRGNVLSVLQQPGLGVGLR